MLRRMPSRGSRSDDVMDNKTGGVNNQGFDSFGVKYENDGNNRPNNNRSRPHNDGRSNNNRPSSNNRPNNRGVDNRGVDNRGVDNRAYRFSTDDFKGPANGELPADHNYEHISAASMNITTASAQPPPPQRTTSHDPKDSGHFVKTLVALGGVFVILIAAIVIVAVIFTGKIQSNQDLVNSMNDTINELKTQNAELKQLQAATTKQLEILTSSTSKDLADLEKFRQNMSKYTADAKKVGQFAFTGFEHGLSENDRGTVIFDHECKGGTNPLSVFECLLFCYDQRSKDSNIDGVLMNKDDNTYCCCERNTKSVVANPDEIELHYVLTYFK